MFGRTRGGDDGWVEDEMQDGTRFRYRIGLDRISQIEPEVLRILADEARLRGVTVVDYIRDIAGMKKQELHVHRDRIRRGEGGDRLNALYQAWLAARDAVHHDQQFLMHGRRPSDPPFWL